MRERERERERERGRGPGHGREAAKNEWNKGILVTSPLDKHVIKYKLDTPGFKTKVRVCKKWKQTLAVNIFFCNFSPIYSSRAGALQKWSNIGEVSLRADPKHQRHTSFQLIAVKQTRRQRNWRLQTLPHLWSLREAKWKRCLNYNYKKTTNLWCPENELSILMYTFVWWTKWGFAQCNHKTEVLRPLNQVILWLN